MSAASSATPGAAPAASAAAPDAAALQKQIDELTSKLSDTKTELGETRRAAEFYEKKAKETPAPAAAEAEDDVDVLEAITTKGAKGLGSLLDKLGYVKAADVDKTVNAKTADVLKQQEMLKQYPDLSDKKSEFFKETADAYGQLIKEGVAPNVAMGIAAERVELRFMREGKIKTPAETKAEKERDRKARIAAQGGEGVGRTPGHAEEEDEELTAEQERIVKAMLVGTPGKDGKPMDLAQATEVYKARAKAGVAMKGIK